MMKEPVDSLTAALMKAYEAMKMKGHVMESGEIEYDDGRRFTYKITEQRTKKGKRSA